MSGKKKILVVVGAGASIDLGMPSVKGINELFIQWAKDEFPLASNEHDNLYSFFVREIENYKAVHLEETSRTATNFEEVLYTMYLLPAFFLNGIFTSAIGAFLGVRKLPDIRRFGEHRKTDSNLLGLLTKNLIKKLLDEFRKRCLDIKKNPTKELTQWNDFLTKLDNDFELAIVNLNYDNCVHQALPSLNTGFDSTTKLFQPEAIFYRKNWRCLLHLHGSVHFDNWQGLKWIDDLNPDLGGGIKSRSDIQTKEGLCVPLAEIVIGYGKLSQLSSQPFRTYHAELDRLVQECEGVLFLGYGFADDHLNSAFSGYRNGNKRPVVVIDYADGDTMTIRSTYDVSPTAWSAAHLFGNDPSSMKWRDWNFPTRVQELKAVNEFEYSAEPDKPLSIWYGGMQNACCNYEKVVQAINGEL